MDSIRIKRVNKAQTLFHLLGHFGMDRAIHIKHYGVDLLKYRCLLVINASIYSQHSLFSSQSDDRKAIPAKRGMCFAIKMLSSFPVA